MHFNTRRLTTALATLVFIALAVPANALAQSIFDRLGNQVKQQFEQELQRAVPKISPPSFTPPRRSNPQQPAYRGLSLPNEGGSQNNKGSFGPGDFFTPSNGNGSGNRPVPYIPPSSSRPTYDSGINTYPGNSYPQSTTTYREPPIAAGDFNGGTIKIRCPKDSAQPVTYRLILGGKSFAYTMRPGESQSFAENKLWLIRYINGSEEVTYRLRGDNVYAFETGNGRTQLFREDPSLNEFPEPPTRDGN